MMPGAESSDAIDRTILNVEHLYTALTGRAAPGTNGGATSSFPPEKAPAQYVEEQLDQLLVGLERLSSTISEPAWVPRLTVWRTAEDLVVGVDVPGVPRESVELRLVAPNVLELTGERPRRPSFAREGDESCELRHAETPRGRFRRLILLPDAVSPEQLQAKLEDGELQIRLPRADAASSVRRKIKVE